MTDFEPGKTMEAVVWILGYCYKSYNIISVCYGTQVVYFNVVLGANVVEEIVKMHVTEGCEDFISASGIN